MTLIVALAAICSIMQTTCRKTSSGGILRFAHGARSGIFIGLPLLGTCQIAFQLIGPLSDGPVAAMIAETARLTTLFLFYLLARQAITKRQDVRFLLGCLAAIGLLEAGYGLLNLLAGNEYLLIYKRQAYIHSATGTLVNRNHFATLMEMLLPATLAFTATLSVKDRTRIRIRESSDDTARAVMLGTACLLGALAIFFSRSRMGMASILIAIITMTVLNRSLQPARNPREAAPQSSGRAVAVLMGATALIFALAIGIDPVVERFFHLQQALTGGGRPMIWRATLAMVADKPILGHGLGTFESLLPYYRDMPTGVFYDHAHNDYLEMLAEGGMLGLGLALALVVAFLRRLLRTLASPLTTAQRSVVFWLGTGILSVLLHSAADFGLRITAVAFTFVLLAAIFSRVTEEPGLVEDRRHRPSSKRAALDP